MQVVQELDAERWRAFVDESPQASVFHTPEMHEVFARADGHEPELWVALNADGWPLALFNPVQITVLGGPLRFLTSRAVAYGSVLCASDSEGKQALDELLRVYEQRKKSHVLFTELRNVSELNGFQPVLNARGYCYEDHLNFLIDLTQPEARLWSNIRSNARRNIRKAQADVTVEEIDDPAALPAVYTTLKAVYKRIQVPLPDESLFRAAFDVLWPRDMMRILVARAGGAADAPMIGALTLLIYRGVMTYWYTGTLREYSALRPSDLLVWDALKMGADMGCRLFDFGGGGRPDEEYGVRDFKAKFGGELVGFGRNVRVHAPRRLALSQAGYQVMRKYL
jgi:CelD/BcsL family acetyltransferase involved in cellulose biosynthesis